MIMNDTLKIVFVGHVDHGKSTLIGRLLYDTKSLSNEKYNDIEEEAKKSGKDIEFAFVMDHLKEERDKKITIDTAQTFFSSDKREYVIIDAPGHKEFIKNMVTGASQAEAAILMIDANEGVMEQTKRHAYILSLLGIDQVVVAINKMDLVEYNKERFEKIKKDIVEFLENMKIKPKFVVPVSAKKGDNIVKKSDNMKWYNGPNILGALDKMKPASTSSENPLRFPVQDVYEFDGEKIVVGRIESGKIRSGQTAVILPENKTCKIIKIKKFEGEIKEATAGESIGIILDKNTKRGDVISDRDDMPKKRRIISAKLFWLSPEKVKTKEKIIFKSTTQESICEIEKIKKRINSSSLKIIEENSEKLEEHEVGEVEIKLDKPVFIDEFNKIKEMGRFVLERNGTISGGGIITGD